ncbi:STAS domain-containing protein [Nonomuraea sp. NPDC050790]|uniref:STAS domain-containing protein n=1 Tax=Nonomuraea sp. NPDC050790 TaxID=3364371 RepID=UPI0037B28D8D
MSGLDVSCEHARGVTLIRVAGEVDATNSAGLATAIEQARRPGVPVVLDLAGMTFLDSSGLKVLLSAHLLGEGQGSPVHLAAVQPMPVRVLRITGVLDRLNVHDTLERAWVAVSSNGHRP